MDEADATMMASGERQTPAVTCLGCGCTCDDIVVTTHAGRITQAENACDLGRAWFGDGGLPAAARLDGRDVSREAAIAGAAECLARAIRPLVYLARDVTCEAQREAIALADLVRGVVDHPTSSAGLDGLLAAQERGRAGATLGELKNRADLLVFWGVDPAPSHPRFQRRYGSDAVGVHTGRGRGSRTVVAIDIGAMAGPPDADVRFSVAPNEEAALLETLRARVLGGGALGDPVPEAQADAFYRRLAGASYVAFVAAGTEGGSARAHGLVALTQAVNRVVRCALCVLRPGGNASGAEVCLTSQTGFPVAVDFGRGHPRYRPRDGRAVDLIERLEVDVAIVIGSTTAMPTNAVRALQAVRRRVVVGPGASLGPFADSPIVVDSGLAGVHDGGLVYRMDDVPIALRPVLDGPPNAASLVAALRAETTRLRA